MGTKYTITIEVSRDGMDTAPATVGAVLEVGADGEPRLVELTVRAPEHGQAIAEAAGLIDLEDLVRTMSAALDPGPSTVSTAAASQTRSAFPPTSPDTGKTRPYRRMPDVDEVRDAYLQTGESVGKLAHHYEVPRYTAQAWVDRLKRMGEIEAAKK